MGWWFISPSRPLEDCKLPLLPESMVGKLKSGEIRKESESQYCVVEEKRVVSLGGLGVVL
ncbi:hypothetical protein Hanom_Chr05g00473921 [Helianthus anomalus]